MDRMWEGFENLAVKHRCTYDGVRRSLVIQQIENGMVKLCTSYLLGEILERMCNKILVIRLHRYCKLHPFTVLKLVNK